MLGLAETGQVGIDGGGHRTLVTEVDLDLSKVLALLKQVGGVGMAQGVDMGVFGNAAGLEREPKGALERGATHGSSRRGTEPSTVPLGGKEQCAVTMGFPLLTQPLQGAPGQRHVTILIALALADVQEHAPGVNVADLELEAFAQTQAAGVNGGQTNAVIQKCDACQNAAHLGDAEDDRQFELGIGANQLDLGRPGTAEGFLPEKLEGTEGLGGSLAGDLLDGLEMDEVLAELLGGDLIGRRVEVFAELANAGEVSLFGAGADGQELQVFGEGIKDGVRRSFFICIALQS